MSKAHKGILVGYKQSEQTNQKNRENHLSLWKDPNYRNRQIESHTGKKFSIETKIKMSIAQKQRQEREHV